MRTTVARILDELKLAEKLQRPADSMALKILVADEAIKDEIPPVNSRTIMMRRMKIWAEMRIMMIMVERILVVWKLAEKQRRLADSMALNRTMISFPELERWELRPASDVQVSLANVAAVIRRRKGIIEDNMPRVLPRRSIDQRHYQRVSINWSDWV